MAQPEIALLQSGWTGNVDLPKRHVRRSRAPRALVPELGTRSVEPSRAREGVRLGLGELVAFDDRDARVRSQSVEVGPARRAGVRDVRQVRVGNVPGGGADRAVPGAVAAAESRRVVARGRGDDVLGVGVGDSRSCYRSGRRRSRPRRPVGPAMVVSGRRRRRRSRRWRTLWTGCPRCIGSRCCSSSIPRRWRGTARGWPLRPTGRCRSTAIPKGRGRPSVLASTPMIPAAPSDVPPW